MPSQRQDSFDAIAIDGSFDVVVVGGGINGIGVYRELSLQGLRVLLVERNDFCSGCSAAPSRMIHGGLRYLENGEFDLVRESLAERDALLRNAPHFVRPLPTTIPITSLLSGTLNAVASFLGKSGKPARRGALPIKLGLSLYDWVTRKNRTLPKHKFRSSRATRARWPQLTNGVRFSATYHDAWISYPERLGLEMVMDVAQECPTSIALNYAELTHRDGGYLITDRKSGQEITVATKALVNATGAWLDETSRALAPNVTHKKPLISGTKGSHLILDNPDVLHALAGNMIFFENDDGRVCIVFPYLGKVLVGSTDIRVDAVTRVRCEPEEQDYILESLRRLFPDIGIQEDHIVFNYSGIRPLPNSDQQFTGRISRGHFTKRLTGDVPQFCMVGGKWTTFRAFAEQTADDVLKELDLNRRVNTFSRAIGGGSGYPEIGDDLTVALGENLGITPDRARHLAERYGTTSDAVINYCASFEHDQKLVAASQYSSGEIAYLTEHEFVNSLSDVVLRRTDLAISGLISTDLIDCICEIMTNVKSWSPKQVETERQMLIDDLQDFHGVSLDMLQNRNEKRNE